MYTSGILVRNSIEEHQSLLFHIRIDKPWCSEISVLSTHSVLSALKASSMSDRAMTVLVRGNGNRRFIVYRMKPSSDYLAAALRIAFSCLTRSLLFDV